MRQILAIHMYLKNVSQTAQKSIIYLIKNATLLKKSRKSKSSQKIYNSYAHSSEIKLFLYEKISWDYV